MIAYRKRTVADRQAAHEAAMEDLRTMRTRLANLRYEIVELVEAVENMEITLGEFTTEWEDEA